MKTITTFIFALIVSAGIAQTRYYKLHVKYFASDGCWHTNSDYVQVISGSYGFEDLYKALCKYVKPYKIRKETFEIDSYVISTKKEYIKNHSDKFEPCCSLISSTQIHVFTPNEEQTATNYAFILAVRDNAGNLGSALSISSKDSSGNLTVKFSPKKVHFINDSTFQIKQ